MKQMFVYIMTNQNKSVLYTGVTNDLTRRVREHQRGDVPGFTQRYSLSRLVFYEGHSGAESAICREKQIKSGSRAMKEALIEGMNPGWKDLAECLELEG
jgi:putative endonuclease